MGATKSMQKASPLVFVLLARCNFHEGPMGETPDEVPFSIDSLPFDVLSEVFAYLERSKSTTFVFDTQLLLTLCAHY
jgi:hypothetical protein